MLQIFWAVLSPIQVLVSIIAIVIIITIANTTVTTRASGGFCSSSHAGGEGWTHQGHLPPIRNLVLQEGMCLRILKWKTNLWKTIVDNGVKYWLVAAHPVRYGCCPVSPVVMCLILYTTPLDAKSER